MKCRTGWCTSWNQDCREKYQQPQICTCYHWASLIAQLVKNLLQCRRPWFYSWVRKIIWRSYRLPNPVFLGFPGDLAGKESACNAGDLNFIPGLGRSPKKEKGYPSQYSVLENSMDCIVHGVTKSWTWLIFTHITHTPLMAESEERLKSFLMRLKEESEKADLKLNIKNIKIMASSPIISWQIEEGTIEAVTDFFSWALKSLQMVTAAMKLKKNSCLEGKLWQT